MTATAPALLTALPVDQIRQAASPWEMLAAELEVVDAASYAEANAECHKIKAYLELIDAKIGPPQSHAHKTWQAICKLRKELEAEPTAADKVFRAKMLAYHQAEQRRAAEAAARAAAEARAVREAAEKEAAALAAQGEAELAEVALAHAEMAAAPPAVIAPPRAAGSAVRENWTAEVTDKRAFLQAVLDGVIPLEAVMENTALLNQMARALKSELAWPGVKTRDRGSIAIR